jgi:hypothetical protein
MFTVTEITPRISASGSGRRERLVTRAAAFRRCAIPALVLLIAVSAVVVLALHNAAPVGAPPPASQTNNGVAPVLARALWSVVRGHTTG